MSEPTSAEPFDHERALAQVRREFVGGLGARLVSIRVALDRLAREFAPRHAEAFYLPVHSLKGTAAAFGATELVPHATRLADLGRVWRESGAAPPATDVASARRELELLETAVQRYVDRLPDGGS